MAAPIHYTWQQGDRLWRVCARLYPSTGYTGVVALKEGVRSLNRIPNSLAIAPGTVIYIPTRS